MIISMEYIPAKTIISKTKDANWFGTDYNMNIYKGCCHGCIYCDSRSDCYRITDFDKVRAKDNALVLIRDELRRKQKTGVVGTGAMSDPYNPYEKELKLTRHGLEIQEAYGFGTAIATKSALITRDCDILKTMKEQAPVICKITITNYRDDIAAKIEPGVNTSTKRFEAISKLADEGIFTGVLFMPLLPYISDNKENIRETVARAKDNGARFIYPLFGVTLRNTQREYYYHKLDQNFPGLKEKYIKKYGNRYLCSSARQKELYEYFADECEKHKLLYHMKHIIASYKSGYQFEQLSLF
ncbi:radical SAM protein [Anaerocolumna cellulosilytica]|uniref:Radical SAM protein n=2 Tax=Anaerocolumna cellulosilytica TaxID=433286 RepID=A0A6S6RB59_9FIRM|nr:DNA repair photolyase [Anaerocolumna cellulosilytica]BCJ96041.1 radical SAM protein [Anaerocolumna cellulosilytica]